MKVRRLDSRRRSLEPEGRALEAAWRHGASPKPYYYGRDVIVMEYVGGPSLGWAYSLGLLTGSMVSEALEAARSLDNAGILHLELHRPWENIVYTSTMKALIVDLDSHSRGCGNVARLVSGLARISSRLLREVREGDLREALREYYRRGCPRDVYLAIKNMVLDALGL